MLHRRSIVRIGLVLAAAAIACGRPRPAPVPAASPLRVVVPLAAPPYAWAEGGRLVGLEVDYAAELAAALGRPLDLQALPFGDVLPTLVAGRADVAMAGLTVTPAREVQIAFSEPYVRSGLLALVRREDAGRYPTPESVVRRGQAIGVVQGTTGERFVNERVGSSAVAA